VKNEDFWNHAIAPEVCRHGHVQLRGHDVRQFVKAERGFMTVDPLGDFLPVLRPEIPEHKVRSLRCGKISEPVNSTVLPNPVSRIYVVGMRLLREARPDGLLGREETLLRLSYIIEPSGGLFVGSWHGIIPQLSWGIMH